MMDVTQKVPTQTTLRVSFNQNSLPPLYAVALLMEQVAQLKVNVQIQQISLCMLMPRQNVLQVGNDFVRRTSFLPTYAAQLEVVVIAMEFGPQQRQLIDYLLEYPDSKYLFIEMLFH